MPLGPLPSPPSQYPGHTGIKCIRKSPGTVSPIFQTTEKRSHVHPQEPRNPNHEMHLPLIKQGEQGKALELTHLQPKRYLQCFCWLWEGDHLSYLSIIESHIDQFPVLLRLAPQDKCVIVLVFSSLLILFFLFFSIGSERVVQWALVVAPFQQKKSILSSCLPIGF